MTFYVSLVVVRTLTGHRSNCTSVDFHPFGEFFASGSLDTNLKIWDIRKKGCIHTYKGHTRGVNAIRFTPDGRWVVSGGEDNTVKVRVNFLFYDIKYICTCLLSGCWKPHAYRVTLQQYVKVSKKYWNSIYYCIVTIKEKAINAVSNNHN
jgi:WD40 repeat protein